MLLDVGRVHEGGVIRGDHSPRRIRRRIGRNGFADQIGVAFFRALENFEARAGGWRGRRESRRIFASRRWRILRNRRLVSPTNSGKRG